MQTRSLVYFNKKVQTEELSNKFYISWFTKKNFERNKEIGLAYKIHGTHVDKDFIRVQIDTTM